MGWGVLGRGVGCHTFLCPVTIWVKVVQNEVSEGSAAGEMGSKSVRCRRFFSGSTRGPLFFRAPMPGGLCRFPALFGSNLAVFGPKWPIFGLFGSFRTFTQFCSPDTRLHRNFLSLLHKLILFL